MSSRTIRRLGSLGPTIAQFKRERLDTLPLCTPIHGRGLAEAQGLAPKHAIKQVDRLFRNELLSVEELAPYWLEFVAGNRTKLVVSLDWTAFATCDHRTLVLSVIARDKRATPVLWKTVQRSGIQRISVEDELLERLRSLRPCCSANITSYWALPPEIARWCGRTWQGHWSVVDLL